MEREIIKIINSGNVNIIDNDDILLTEKIISLALRKGYNLKKMCEKMITHKVVRNYLSKYFSFDFNSIDNIEDLVDVLKSRNHLTKDLFLFMKYKGILSKLDIDVYKIFKYCLYNNSDLDYLNLLIKENKLDEYITVFEYLKKNYFDEVNDYEIYNIFLKGAYNYYKNPKFYNELINRNLNNKERYCFYKYFKSQSNYYNITVDNLLDCDINDSLSNYIKSNNVNIDILKGLLIKYLFNMKLEDYDKLVPNKISMESILSIYNSTNNSELKYKVKLLEIVILYMDKINNIMKNDDDLINYCNYLIDNEDKFIDFRDILFNINRHINDMYEMNFNDELIDLSKCPMKKYEYNDSSIYTIDLTSCKYTILAHTYRFDNIEELVIPNLVGKQTICLSSITELSQEHCFNGIIVGYTFVYKGNYITSSNRDLYSDFYTNINSIKVFLSSLNIKEMPIRLLAHSSISSSELLLYRDNLIPSCILSYTLKPSNQNMEAAIRLTNEIRKIKGYENYVVPIVYINQSMLLDSNNISNIDTNDYKELDELKELVLNGYNNKFHKGITSMETYIEDNRVYLLKHINKDNYIILNNIRKLVYSIAYKYIDNSNLLFNSNINIKLLDNYIGFNIENECTDYTHRKGIYTKKELFQFLLEMIIDYLSFTKNIQKKEFYYDNYYNIYRINRDNIMMYDHNYEVDNFYTNLFWQCDEDLLKIFNNIIDDISNLDNDIYISLLNSNIDILLEQKNNIKKYFNSNSKIKVKR